MNKFRIWIYYNWKNLYYYRNSVVWFGRADGLQIQDLASASLLGLLAKIKV